MDSAGVGPPEVQVFNADILTVRCLGDWPERKGGVALPEIDSPPSATSFNLPNQALTVPVVLAVRVKLLRGVIATHELHKQAFEVLGLAYGTIAGIVFAKEIFLGTRDSVVREFH